MLRSDYDGQVCSIARGLELVGERWTLLIIRDVFHGRRRFEEIQSSLGIARNVLTSRLARLVEEDILERRPYSERPRRDSSTRANAAVRSTSAVSVKAAASCSAPATRASSMVPGCRRSFELRTKSARSRPAGFAYSAGRGRDSFDSVSNR